MRQIGGVEQNLILACKRKDEEQAWEVGILLFLIENKERMKSGFSDSLLLVVAWDERKKM
jgi:hypothetical protein